MLFLAAIGLQASPVLEESMLNAVRTVHFEQVLDFGPTNEGRDVQPGVAKPISHVPNIDLAIILLDAKGHAIDWANILLSRDYPQAIAVPVTIDDGSSSVHFRRWDIDRWNGGKFPPASSLLHSTKGWTNDPPFSKADDLVPGRDNARYEFMAPYPASLFKLLIAFHVMRMVDSGAFSLASPYIYTVVGEKPETRVIKDWLDPMITASDNFAARALVQFLHRYGQIDAVNREMQDLGLATLQINGTSETDGGNWQPGRIHMTAFDTARLLWLIEGGEGILWKKLAGDSLTNDFLTESSRRYLKQLLADQGLNEALSTGNLASFSNVRPGIPALVPTRWMNPTNGKVLVHGVDFGMDVRKHNQQAEVAFAHKTGLTYNYGSDAGIVTSLPGQPYRRYIISFFSNLGYRYADEVFANRSRGPYADPVSPISYTQRIPEMAKHIDDSIKQIFATRRP